MEDRDTILKHLAERKLHAEAVSVRLQMYISGHASIMKGGQRSKGQPSSVQDRKAPTPIPIRSEQETAKK